MFIAIEGLDNSGKTTLAYDLKQALIQKGIPYNKIVSTHEPWVGSPHTVTIRRILTGELPMPSPSRLCQLFVDARRDHSQYLIDRALKEGYFIICDRYILSTLCYNTSDYVTLEDLQQEIFHIESDQRHFWVAPSLFVYMQISPYHAMQRAQKRSEKRDLFDESAYATVQLRWRKYEYFATQRNPFLLCHHIEPSSPILTINAMCPREENTAQIIAYLGI